jgi:hypothetical protein
MSLDPGYIYLRRGVLTADLNNPQLAIPPTSGQTITLWSSEGTVGPVQANADRGARWKRIWVNIYSSHASAADGLSFEETNDDGVNWDVNVSYTIAATTYTKVSVAVSAGGLRIRYTNSANTLSAWRFGVLGDSFERAGP